MLKKLNRINQSQKAEFMVLLGQLLANGYSLLTSLDLVVNFKCLPGDYVTQIRQRLAAGQELGTALAPLGLPLEIVYKLQLAQQHGNLCQVCSEYGELAKSKQAHLRKIRELLAYPTLILIFIVGLTLVFHRVIQPELNMMSVSESEQTSVLPMIPFIVIALLAALVLGGCLWFFTTTRVQRIQSMLHWPLIGKIIGWYYAYLILGDWAAMFKHGLSMTEILNYMLTLPQDTLQHVLAANLLDKLNQGHDLATAIIKTPWLPVEAAIIFEKGAEKKYWGAELHLLSQRCYQLLQQSLKRLIEWVQPISLIMVGLLIIWLYYDMLFPMYSMLNQLS